MCSSDLYSAGLLCGQMLFKLAANRLRAAGEGTLLEKTVPVLFDPYFIAAAAMYMGLSVMWVWMLQTVPISRAYPVVAINFALVAIIGALFFAERLTGANWAGVALIVAGVALVTIGD